VESFAILIPTHNRPRELTNLLRSIEKSTRLPAQVVIVASGLEVAHIVEEFSKSLEITYLYTIVKGQIAQKRIGMELVSKKVDWCVFLDDDLILQDSAIDLALSAARSYKKRDIIGIGLSLPPLSRALNISRVNKKLLEFFKLSSSRPGEVLSSGYATSYLQETSVVETQWLNGASIWRTKYARNYGMNIPSTPYAACEDLIFSYPLSKRGTLIYVPEARAMFQDNELSKFNSFRVMEAAALWRFYFVSKHKELSLGFFFLSHLIRTLYAMLNPQDPKLMLLNNLMALNWKLFQAIITKRDPRELLSELRH
jgi:GT2 family glycosyltransferase